jgi:hypothetical protein
MRHQLENNEDEGDYLQAIAEDVQRRWLNRQHDPPSRTAKFITLDDSPSLEPSANDTPIWRIPVLVCPDPVCTVWNFLTRE